MDALLLTAAFLAGLIDAIAGGGGLIQLPALFSTYNTAPAATLLGTNKLASIGGTSIAWLRYRYRVTLPWEILRVAALSAFAFALIGAWIATQIDSKYFRIALPFILFLLFIYTLLTPKLGTQHTPAKLTQTQATRIALLAGAAMGFYDGLFGPATGSLLMFIFVRAFGFDFLHASVAAKFVNIATNLAAFFLFSLTGHIWWQIGLLMAIANISGNLFGSTLALRYGSRFVRIIFMFVVAALIVKTAIEAVSQF